MIQSLKHSEYLNVVKKLLKADFVGWVTEKDQKTLKIKVKSNVHYLPLEGEINEETYKDLVRKILAPESQTKPLSYSPEKEIKTEENEKF